MLTDAQRAEGWIEHDGGERSAPEGTQGAIYVMLRCGIMGWVTPQAQAWVRHSLQPGISYNADTDIIAYRKEPT